MNERIFPSLPFEIVSLILECWVALSPRKNASIVCQLNHTFLPLGRRWLYGNVVLYSDEEERLFIDCMQRTAFEAFSPTRATKGDDERPTAYHYLASLVRSVERCDEVAPSAPFKATEFLVMLANYPLIFSSRIKAARLSPYFRGLRLISIFVSFDGDDKLPMAFAAEVDEIGNDDLSSRCCFTSLLTLSASIDEKGLWLAVLAYQYPPIRICISIFPYLDSRITTSTSVNAIRDRLRIDSYPGILRNLYSNLSSQRTRLGHTVQLLVLRYDLTCGEFCVVSNCSQHPRSPYANHIAIDEMDQEAIDGKGVNPTRVVTICCDWGQSAPTSSARNYASDKALMERIWQRMVCSVGVPHCCK